MARATHWKIPFTSVNGTSYEVRIYEDNYSGGVVTLTGCVSPFETQEDSDDDAFKAIRTSSGYIRIIVDSINSLPTQIMADGILSRYVQLVRNVSGAWTIEWQGYIQPENYSSDYAYPPYSVEFPVCSLLETLKSVPYTVLHTKQSLGAILKNCLSQSNGSISSVYLPDTGYLSESFELALMVDDTVFDNSETDDYKTFPGTNANLTNPSERTSCYSVIESICKYFGWQLHERGNNLYFCKVNASCGFVSQSFSNLGTSTISQQVSSSTLSSFSYMDNNNKRDFVQGRSFIDIAESVKELKDPVDVDVMHYKAQGVESKTFDSRWYLYPDSLTKKGVVGIECNQYDKAGSTSASADILDDHEHNTHSYSGGNVIKGIIATELEGVILHRNNNDIDNYVQYIALGHRSGDTASPAVTFKSTRAISSDLFKNGLIISGNVKSEDNDVLVENRFPYNPNGQWEFKIKWGSYYLRGNQAVLSWQQDEGTCRFNVKPSSSTDSKNEGAAHFFGGKASMISSLSVLETEHVNIPPLEGVNDVLSITIMTPKTFSFKKDPDDETSITCHCSLIENFKVEANGKNPILAGTNTDISENHWKADIGKYFRETYEHSNTLASHMDTQQVGENFVYSGSDYYSGQPESELLTRLQSWYGRVTEKLTLNINSQFNLLPFDKIAIDGAAYEVISVASDYAEDTDTVIIMKKP